MLVLNLDGGVVAGKFAVTQEAVEAVAAKVFAVVQQQVVVGVVVLVLAVTQNGQLSRGHMSPNSLRSSSCIRDRAEDLSTASKTGRQYVPSVHSELR